jgi:hypothetical protein
MLDDPIDLKEALSIAIAFEASRERAVCRGSSATSLPLLQAYDFPCQVIDKEDEIARIPDAYEWHRLQKRPFVLFLTKRLLGVKNA